LLCGDLRLFFLVVAPPCIDFRIPPSILLGFEPSCCLGLLKVAVFLLRNIQINIINSKREPTLLTSPFEDVQILIKTPAQLHLVNPPLPLHPLLNPVLALCPRISEIKSAQALRAQTFRIGDVDVMSLLCSRGPRGRLEIDGPNGALSQVPMLDGRHSVHRRTKRLLETGRLVEVSSAASRGLIRQLKVLMIGEVLVRMRSLAGRWRIVGGNLELRCPFHSQSWSGVVAEYGSRVERFMINKIK
jgi:hypothetical protein